MLVPKPLVEFFLGKVVVRRELDRWGFVGQVTVDDSLWSSIDASREEGDDFSAVGLCDLGVDALDWSPENALLEAGDVGSAVGGGEPAGEKGLDFGGIMVYAHVDCE